MNTAEKEGTGAAIEIRAGERFAFGSNWSRFLGVLDEERIAAAERSLQQMLRVEHLHGQSFLDIGSGSGLFSLAARRLGAAVHSFDFDPQSVACTSELRRRYFSDDPGWIVEKGSVLDTQYMETLGYFDIVYSWGVLHHTGAMWTAIANAADRVNHDDGKFFIAIYNDQGWKSRLWWLIKYCYNRLPGLLQGLFASAVSILVRTGAIVKYTLKLQPMTAISPLLRDTSERGMSARYDELDWIGGFPFEVASYERLEKFLATRGLVIVNAKRNASWGCNELVLRRISCAE